MALTATQIQNAYVAFFNRPADVAGLNYWSTYAGNAADLLNTFAQSAEYKALYANMNNTQVVNAVYQNLFNHAPDVAGLNYWVGQLDGGALGIGNVADAINKGAQGTDSAIITNKVTAASAFTTALDTTAEVVAYAGVNAAGINSVRAWLNTVTSDAASVTSATGSAMNNLLTTIQSNSSSGAVGQTFTLTTGTDFADTAGAFRNSDGAGTSIPSDFKFTTGNELVAATHLTLDAGGFADTLADGSTVDNDVLSLTLGAAVITSSISNIETINVTATPTVGNLTLTGVTGVKSIVVTGTPGAAFTIDGGLAANAIGDTGVTLIDASGLKGTASALTINSSGSIATAALTIKGGAGADSLTGGGAADTIEGGAGNDTLNGGNGNDTVSGGAGDDIINGGGGADTLNGDAGVDAIESGAGADKVFGGAGNDAIANVGGGKDTITGGAGNDAIALNLAVTASETVIFGADLAANGQDAITNFVFGAVNDVVGGDVLNFSAFLGAAASAVGAPTDVTDGLVDVFTGNVVYINAALAAAAAPVGFLADSKIVLLEDVGANVNISYVTTGAGGTIESTELVGVLTAVSGNFSAGQIVGA